MTGSSIWFCHFWGIQSTVQHFQIKNAVGRERTPHHLPQPQFLAHRAQLSIRQGGVEHRHDHIRLSSDQKTFCQLRSRFLTASLMPTIRNFHLHISFFVHVFHKNIFKTCKLPKCKEESCLFNNS